MPDAVINSVALRSFKVPLGCTNCSATWEITVPFKTEAKGHYGGVWIHPADCHGGALDCTGFHPNCPRCGRHEEVYKR